MEKRACKCGKVIEGYTAAQVDYLLKQHLLSKAHGKKKARK